MSALTFDTSFAPSRSFVTRDLVYESTATEATAGGQLGIISLAAVVLSLLVANAPSANARTLSLVSATSPTATGVLERGAVAHATTDAKITALGAPPEVTQDALAFAAAAADLGVILPEPRLTDDGEIMFYGRNMKSYVDIGVNGDGTYSFFCRDGQGREASSDDDIPICSGIDSSLVKAIRSLG